MVMKKALLIFAVCILIPVLSFSQFVIENSTFENWTSSGSYEDPDGWDTPNATTSTFMGYTVTKSTDVNEGSFSARLQTTNIIINIPGVLVNGNFELQIPSGNVVIDGGVPFTDRPLNFTGYYKYTPSGVDSCAFVLGLFKNNTLTGNRDTVGYAQFYQSGTISTWTMFDVDVIYNSAEIPDSMLVVISSSNPDNPVSGSTLFVDGLELSGGSLGVYKLFSDNDLETYPNPVNDILILNLKSPSSGTLRVYDIIGKQTFKQQVERKSKIRIDMSDMPQGLYFVEFQTAGQKVTRKVFKN